MPQTISMILDENNIDFEERVKNVVSERHSTGVTFQKIFMSDEDTIRLQLSDSFMDFKHPMQIDIAHMTGNIDDFSMYLGVSDKNSDTHEYTKKYMYDLVKELRSKGWKRYISSIAPRIVPEEIIAYNSDSRVSHELSLSDTYEMSMEEWVSIGTFHWSFYYKNEAILYIHLRREGGANKKSTSDGYLLDIDVESPTSFIRYSFKANDRKGWEKRWKPMTVRYLARRPGVEEDVKELGYHIDETYIDAPFERGVLPGEEDTFLNKDGSFDND